MMTKPLKVMQLVLSLVIGGTEKLVYDIIRRMDKQRVSPVICCLDELGLFGERLRQEGYQVYVLNRTPGLDWGLLRQINGIVQKEHIDVIHAHQYAPYFYGLMASVYSRFGFFANTPRIVFTEHGRFYPDQKKLKRILLNPVLSLFTDEIVTISESTKQSLITYENFPARRIKVVYNGIEFDQFSRKIDRIAKKQAIGLPSDSQVVGIVARLDPIKNHALLLRAFQRVVKQISETYLLIIGDGPENQGLKTLTESLAIHDRVMFLGARTDIPELLQICDVFALSSFSEGTSVTLIEAMAAGLPIVATRVGGNPEVVKENECGYLVQSDNDQEMAAMLLKLLRDKETRQRMGQVGRHRAQTMFSLNKMVNAYIDLYFKVTTSSRS